MFNKELHIKYFQRVLAGLPHHYVGLDTSRMTAIYFAVVGLDMLGVCEEGYINKKQIIDYVYSLQLDNSMRNIQRQSSDDENAEANSSSSGNSSSNRVERHKFGFIGSPYSAHNYCYCGVFPHIEATNNERSDTSAAIYCNPSLATHCTYQQGNLAMIYTALAVLITLGDDLTRVNKRAIVEGMSFLQNPNGCFRCTYEGTESDTRFLYCACIISSILDDWSAVDEDKAVEYILSCITYEGGISLVPGAEAQGGTTYCALASLALMNKLDCLSKPVDVHADILGWCERKQVGGYQGRTNKDPDSCYSFWVGASQYITGNFSYTDYEGTRSFLLNQCQHKMGGFGKHPGDYPDILHSFYSLCWLSIADNSPSSEDGDSSDGLDASNVSLGLQKINPITGFIK